jgi:hypothetical protein
MITRIWMIQRYTRERFSPTPALWGASSLFRAFAFVQSNPKKGKPGERYEGCKVVTTFTGLKALKGINFSGTTRPVFSGGVMTKGGTPDQQKPRCRRLKLSRPWTLCPFRPRTPCKLP